MRMAGAEKRQQRQAADAGVGLRAGAAAILAERVAFLPGAVPPGVPAAVFRLGRREPRERGANGPFGIRVAAAARHKLRAVRGKAISVSVRHRRRRRCRLRLAAPFEPLEAPMLRRIGRVAVGLLLRSGRYFRWFDRRRRRRVVQCGGADGSSSATRFSISVFDRIASAGDSSASFRLRFGLGASAGVGSGSRSGASSGCFGSTPAPLLPRSSSVASGSVGGGFRLLGSGGFGFSRLFDDQRAYFIERRDFRRDQRHFDRRTRPMPWPHP